MRYIGGKSLMLNSLYDVIQAQAPRVNTILDACTGSGVVSHFFKYHGYSVHSNDALYFSYVLSRGLIQPNFVRPEVLDWIEDLNTFIPNINNMKAEDCFIYQNYSPHDDCTRMYFQCRNALKIDYIRQQIENHRQQLNEDEYFYLLACLISAVPYVANITGTYAAYLKKWDIRSNKLLDFVAIPLLEGQQPCVTYNESINDLCGHVATDLTYLDPPYNERDYLSNYHILETIARYDYPLIGGVTGMRQEGRFKSDFCKKGSVHNAFVNFLNRVQSQYVIISYNNEALLPTAELSEIVRQAGVPDTFRLYEYDYRRYKNKIPNNAAGLKEQLYFIRKW